MADLELSRRSNPRSFRGSRNPALPITVRVVLGSAKWEGSGQSKRQLRRVGPKGASTTPISPRHPVVPSQTVGLGWVGARVQVPYLRFGHDWIPDGGKRTFELDAGLRSDLTSLTDLVFIQTPWNITGSHSSINIDQDPVKSM